MGALTFEDRRLGWLLGLGDIEPREVCHDYANGCICSDCSERAEQQPVSKPVQFPWESESAA